MPPKMKMVHQLLLLITAILLCSSGEPLVEARHGGSLARKRKTNAPAGSNPSNSPSTPVLTSPPHTTCPGGGGNRRTLRSLDGYQTGTAKATLNSDGSQTVVIPLGGAPITMHLKSTQNSQTLDLVTDVVVTTPVSQWIGMGLGSCMVGAYGVVGYSRGVNIFLMKGKNGPQDLVSQGSLSSHGISNAAFSTSGSGARMSFTMTQSQLNDFQLPLVLGGISTMIFAIGGDGGGNRRSLLATLGEHNSAGVFAVQFHPGVPVGMTGSPSTPPPTTFGQSTSSPVTSGPKVTHQSLAVSVGPASGTLDVTSTYNGVKTVVNIILTLNQANSWIGMAVGSAMIGSPSIIGMSPSANPGYSAVGLYMLQSKTSASGQQVLTMDPGITATSYTTSGSQSVLKFTWDSSNSPTFPLISAGAPSLTSIMIAYGGSAFGYHNAWTFKSVLFSA